MALFAGAPSDYTVEIEQWRKQREDSLRGTSGWLSLAGLHWLEEGVENSEVDPGLRFTLRSDRGGGAPDTIRAGTRTFVVIQRGDRFGIRVRDTNQPALRRFRGLNWYPVDPQWRIQADWRPYKVPRDVSVELRGGITEPMVAAGVAEFQVKKTALSLEAYDEAGRLFFVFKDQTSGGTTYAGGRFLYAAAPGNAKKVTLDFNRAENPPCAFTPHTTCPLPSARNRLAVAIEAGERNYVP